MKMRTALLVVLFSTFGMQKGVAQHIEGQPYTHTFSIVAVDTATGDIGVAVQSHWFNVGAVVPWAEAGVGAVATQALVNPSYGPKGLKMLKEGQTPKQVLDQLIKNDTGRDYRQVAIIDKNGKVATYTGDKCIAKAGHIRGTNFSVQANMMLNKTVWPAMADAFRKTKGALADRLIAALQAAQQQGGDIRGQQSAALIVVSGKNTGRPWVDKKIDLRVEDNPHAVDEIARLLKLNRAYDHMNAGDQAIEKDDVKEALKQYGAAQEMFPDNLEMKYWTAVSLANVNRLNQALPLFKEVFEKNKHWIELTRRLVPNGMLKVSPRQLNKILSAADTTGKR